MAKKSEGTWESVLVTALTGSTIDNFAVFVYKIPNISTDSFIEIDVPTLLLLTFRFRSSLSGL